MAAPSLDDRKDIPAGPDNGDVFTLTLGDILGQKVKREVKAPLNALHRFVPGDKVWFVAGRGRPVEGLVKDAYWNIAQALEKRVVRFAVRFEKNTDTKLSSRIVFTSADDRTFTVTAAPGSIAEIHKVVDIIPKGHTFINCSEKTPTMSEILDLDVSSYAYNVGVEMSRMVDGWTYLCEPSVVPAKTIGVTPVYRILGHCGGSLADVDNGVSGELYCPIEDDRVSIRE